MKFRSILMLIALVGVGLPAAATSITVTTTNPAPAADGECSIIEAIDNANDDAATHADCAAGSGADTIVLAASTTYTLTEVNTSYSGSSGLPVISSGITIEGHDSTIERAAAAPSFRLLTVDATGALALRDLTLRHGDSGIFNGGALSNQSGQVQLTRVTVTENTAFGGGGLYNSSGLMALSDSVVSFNVAAGTGGGISSHAGSGYAGLVVLRTSVSNNNGVFGGGISTNGTQVAIINSTISDNQAFSDRGNAWCGGLELEGGVTEIHRSAITGNTAESLGEISGFGGGLCAIYSTTTISNCTISGNKARGGTTLTGGMTGRGGGIMAVGMSVTMDTLVVVEDSTICDNTAETLGGGISAYQYDGDRPVEVELRNTIVVQNLEQGAALPGNCIAESPAVITSADFNLADDVTCGLIAVNDLVVTDAMLSPLADNGGPTLTHMPAAGSPAIDSGDNDACPGTDQRGCQRPCDGDGDDQARCDRGAVEAGAAHLTRYDQPLRVRQH